MSDIIEILGEKKFSGSRNKELKSRIVFEETKKMRYENNLFFNISQQTQYINEKNTSNDIRIYGKINPIMNFNVHQKTSTNRDLLIEVDKTLFNFNLNNWSIVILKSKRFESNLTLNGKQTYTKGIKKLDRKTNTGDTIIDLDLKQGLPARRYISNINFDNFCLFLPLGHNFRVGDRIKVNSLNLDLLDSKIYNVVNVINNMVFINTKPVKRFLVRDIPTNTDVIAKDINDFRRSSNNNRKIVIENSKQKVNNLVFSRAEISTIINTPRPKIQSFIRPDFYVSKVVEKEQLEYYIKSLEVIGVVDQLDTCAFSTNNFNQQIYNFFLNNELDISDLYDNLNQPISDLYLAVIKNGAQVPNTFSDVESHFSEYINIVGSGYGVEKISGSDIIKPKIGDQYLHSVCEYTTENLTEVELMHFKHRFLYKDISFSYDPFFKLEIKLKSPYIEDSDNVENSPNYAVYSRQREKFIWRDIFDIGVTDENGRRIDFPFMNGSFYVFCDINFFLTPESRYVRKYTLNINDVTSLNGSEFTNLFDDAFANLGLNESEVDTIKPFNEYQDTKC